MGDENIEIAKGEKVFYFQLSWTFIMFLVFILIIFFYFQIQLTFNIYIISSV